MCKTSSSVSMRLSTRLEGLAPDGGARVLDMFTPRKNLIVTGVNGSVRKRND